MKSFFYIKSNKLATIAILVLSPLLAYCQFEQKFALNLSIGLVNPYGESDYIKTMESIEPYSGNYIQPVPYLMSNFGAGMVLTGGVQVNINRRFSMAFNLQYFRIKKWEYQYEWNFLDFNTISKGSWMDWKIRESDINPDVSDNTIVESGTNKLSLNDFSIGAMPKLYLLPGKIINPYVFAELSINFTDLKLEDSYGVAKEKYNLSSTAVEPIQNVFENAVGIGIYPGIGIDFKINENIGLFLQSGLMYILINNSKLEDAGYPPEDFKSFKLEAGVRISFLRSKNL